MLVAENAAVGWSWVSVRDRLPFDGHECALICRNLNSNDLRRAIGCRLHGFVEYIVAFVICCPGLLLWLSASYPPV